MSVSSSSTTSTQNTTAQSHDVSICGLPANSNKYATLSMSKSDRIRFMGFPEDIYSKAGTVIAASWPPGIQSEQFYAGSYEYQMKGRPFGTLGTNEALGCRVLLRDILAYLYDRSWVLITSMSLSEKIGSKDTLLFKKWDDERPKVEWLVVQLYHKNKIYLHCTTDHSWSSPPRPESNSTLVTSFQNLLTKLECFEKGHWSQHHDAYEFTLKGGPWRCHGQNSMKARRLLLEMAECLDGLGFESYGAVKQRTENDDWRICDSWYLVRKVQTPPK